MNINDLEKQTGITKQNIRFYEKKGLLHPDRNEENNYREYGQEDLRRLQVIKILRKLDLPIEEIRQVLERKADLDIVIQKQLEVLEERQNELKACIHMCRRLSGTSLETLDAVEVLEEMEEVERKGGIFMSLLEDYKKIDKEENMKQFTFIPDTMVKTPEEFSDALLTYARESNINLVITKAGMYPIFEIDGIEYTADRIWGRYGAIVRCNMTHPEDAEVTAIPEKRRKIFQWISKYWVLILLILFIVLPRLNNNWWVGLLLCLFVIPLFTWSYGYLFRSRN